MTTGERRPRAVRHDEGRAVALPLGGIGTGNVALAADGGLRQWQLHGVGNHRGALPDTFFAVRACVVEPPVDEVRVLQAPPPPPGAAPTPMVDDAEVPGWQRRLLGRERGSVASTFRGCYPFAEVEHELDVPLRVTVEAFTPLSPHDVAESSLPVAMVAVRLTAEDQALHGWFGATLQNAVGWDGVTPLDGNRCGLYGGAVNRLRRAGGWSSLVMESVGTAADAPGAGQMLLAVDSPTAAAAPQWERAEEFLEFLRGRTSSHLPAGSEALAPGAGGPQVSAQRFAEGPSPAGRTWSGGFAVPFSLGPGETTTVRVLLAWHFPNRYVDFEQFGPAHPERTGSRFWIGNAYTQRWVDAVAVAEHVQREWEALESRSRSWSAALLGSSLPLDVVEHLGAQPSLVRSPTCFQTADGRFFGFEGVMGASTGMWGSDHGGSCPLNCTHVWNYAQTASRFFPELERSMRETEFGVAQAPEGYLPHRVTLPVWLPQLWDVPIGGPREPALDGMLGAVLKTLREVRQGAGTDWLRRWWPHVVRLLAHVRERWDPQGTGVLRGVQPSTHDIDLAGVNTFMGTYWLAALRAAERMAGLVGDAAVAEEVRGLFEAGSRAYDEACWNGEYYEQVLEPGDPVDFQWGAGCLSDQLVGQWWAHQLDLGHLLPREHVRTALRSVVRYNLRTGFTDFSHPYRVYADGDDTGLLLCSWPRAGRPSVPTRYADEVWSGVEQQVAAHCVLEGLVPEGMAVLRGLWARHDGRRRNPYNEVECGDHYARAMSGWSALEALTGQSWDAVTGRLRLSAGPVGPGAGDAGPWRVPVLLDRGWGVLEVDGGRARLECRSGCLPVRVLELGGDGWGETAVRGDLHPGDAVEAVRGPA